MFEAISKKLIKTKHLPQQFSKEFSNSKAKLITRGIIPHTFPVHLFGFSVAPLLSALS